MAATTKPILLKKRKDFFKQYTDINVDETILNEFEKGQIQIIKNALFAILSNIESSNESLGIVKKESKNDGKTKSSN